MRSRIAAPNAVVNVETAHVIWSAGRIRLPVRQIVMRPPAVTRPVIPVKIVPIVRSIAGAARAGMDNATDRRVRAVRPAHKIVGAVHVVTVTVLMALKIVRSAPKIVVPVSAAMAFAMAWLRAARTAL